jgi:uncharacterized protein (DUF1501 family)
MPRSNPHHGCDDFRDTEAARRMSRRTLLKSGLGAGLSVYAAQAMSLTRVFEAASAEASLAPDAPVLVSVFLPGGVDLLDTLVPLHDEGRYADVRRSIGRPQAAPLGSTGLGLHPALSRGAGGGIRGLYERGQIGFLPGIDYANPNLSHFHSRAFWETGLITSQAASGWLGRWLDRHGSRDNPLQGLTAGDRIAPVLRTAGAPVASLSGASSADLWMRGLWNEWAEAAQDAYAELAQDGGGRPVPVTTAARLAHQVAGRLEPYRAPKDGPDPLAAPVDYPEGRFAERLRTLAALVAQPLGVRVGAVDADAQFDTHDTQPEVLARELGRVSEALSAFQADLEARGQAHRVLTFVWTEFGRRVQPNATRGTDHGAGGLGWVQGPRAAPGILSDYPSLRSLDRHDNLKVTVDFRRVYASLLEGWMGTDAGDVIPNARAFGRMRVVR